MKAINIIISGGGTGGHIFPAIALADAFKEANQENAILFIGAQGKMEMEKVPEAGYSIKGLPIAGFNRSSMLKNLSLPYKILSSLLQAQNIIKTEKPDVVIGMGGYASLPLLWMASLNKIPYYIQEQNGYAGMANKFLAKKAKKIFVAYPSMEQFFPADKIILTGNPLRNARLSPMDSVAAKRQLGLNPDLKTLFVTGGSLGAKTLNDSIIKHILLLEKHNTQIIWQCGSRYYARLQNDSSIQSPFIQLKGFIEDIAVCYSAADLIIARSGAMTVSELMLVGKPSILVPSPNVTDNHQYKNAKAVAEANAAWLLLDNEAIEKLIPLALDYLNNTNAMAEKAENIKKLAKPKAAKDMVEIIVKEGKWN